MFTEYFYFVLTDLMGILGEVDMTSEAQMEHQALIKLMLWSLVFVNRLSHVNICAFLLYWTLFFSFLYRCYLQSWLGREVLLVIFISYNKLFCYFTICAHSMKPCGLQKSGLINKIGGCVKGDLFKIILRKWLTELLFRPEKSGVITRWPNEWGGQ